MNINKKELIKIIKEEIYTDYHLRMINQMKNIISEIEEIYRKHELVHHNSDLGTKLEDLYTEATDIWRFIKHDGNIKI